MKYEKLRQNYGDMPPLDHYPKRGVADFRWEDSEILKYILEHPYVLGSAFLAMKASGAIVFDPETKKWKGCRWKPHESMEVVGL